MYAAEDSHMNGHMAAWCQGQTCSNTDRVLPLMADNERPIEKLFGLKWPPCAAVLAFTLTLTNELHVSVGERVEPSSTRRQPSAPDRALLRPQL